MYASAESKKSCAFTSEARATSMACRAGHEHPRLIEVRASTSHSIAWRRASELPKMAWRAAISRSPVLRPRFRHRREEMRGFRRVVQ